MKTGRESISTSRSSYLPAWGPYGKIAPSVSPIDLEAARSVDFVFTIRGSDGRRIVPEFDDRSTNCLTPDIRFGPVEAGLARFGYAISPECAGGEWVRIDCRSDGPRCRITLSREGASGDLVPELWAVRPAELRPPAAIRLPEGAVWRGAEHYEALQSPLHQAYDGYRNMVRADASAVDGAVLGRMWATCAGTRVDYAVSFAGASERVRLGLRYRKPRATPGFRQWLCVGDRRIPMELPLSGEWRWHWLELPPLAVDGAVRWSLETEVVPGESPRRTVNGDPAPPGFALDAFVLAPVGMEPAVEAVFAAPPERATLESWEPGQWSLRPDGQGTAYRLHLPAGSEALALESMGEEGAPELGGEVLAGWRLPTLPGRTEAGAAVQQVDLFANRSERVLDLPSSAKPRATDGDPASPRACRGAIQAAPASEDSRSRHKAGRYEEDRSRHKPPSPGADGLWRSRAGRYETAPYGAAYAAMAASCRMNVSFPVIRGGEPIAAHTPGKRWGGLYSWDAGLHGLGLLELEPEAAFACVSTYLTEPEDPEPFVWHGSPVPTQAYLWWELWQRERDREKLAWVFPRLLRYFRYLSGQAEGSPTDRFGNGLLNTFPLFYNTGGWDDLPPQVAVHRGDLTERVTPVVSTAHVVRFARILRVLAMECGADAVAEEMDRAVARHLAAIERTWDDAAGTYSYVWHEDFKPFRDASRTNYNRTLDGVSPLLAGGIDPARAARLWDALGDPARFATPVGLTGVDQSAPYYDPDGYWNGTVWMPYQWMLWKAALDQGRAEPAVSIPRRAAEAWEREVRRTGHTGEYFRVADGRAGGYPLFAGLSAPILEMIAALTEPGRVTVGFDAEVRDVRFFENELRFAVRVQGTPGARPLALLCLGRAGRYHAFWGDTTDGEPCEALEADEMGLAVLTLPEVRDWREVRVVPESGLSASGGCAPQETGMDENHPLRWRHGDTEEACQPREE